MRVGLRAHRAEERPPRPDHVAHLVQLDPARDELRLALVAVEPRLPVRVGDGEAAQAGEPGARLVAVALRHVNVQRAHRLHQALPVLLHQLRRLRRPVPRARLVHHVERLALAKEAAAAHHEDP